MLAAMTVALIGMAGIAQTATAAEGPPLPVAKNGNSVKVFATGVSIPTQIAFKGKTAFISGGAEEKVKGGLYYVSPGSTKAKRVPGTPPVAFGVTWHHGHLYANFGTSIRVFHGWTGKRFKFSKTLVALKPSKFTNFSGLEFGPNGRLYTGVGLQFDAKAGNKAYANSVISIDKRSGKIRTVSTGLRQPWMLTFAKGSSSPFVTVLGQDTPKNTKAPDLIVKATQGANFGFPRCNWSNFKSCRKMGFKQPVLALGPANPSPSPMGITAKGHKLFVALFGGMTAKTGPVGPEIIATNTTGTKISDFVTGFVAPVLLAHYHGGYLYMGDLTGQVYRVRA
jgi:glucose/arabinose dehydrogenase